MRWRDFLITKIAGKAMMATGIGGVVFSLLYDKIVDKPYIDIGFWQIMATIYFIGIAFVGYLLDDFTKDL